MARGLSPDPSTAREILVRGPSWLGDLVMSTPGLHALRTACPAARITLWVREGLDALLAGSPDVDRCLAWPASGGRRTRFVAARAVREETHYDLGICIPDSFSAALAMRFAAARPLVGCGRGGRGGLLDVPVPDAPARRTGGFVAREERVFDLLRALGIACEDARPRLTTTPGEESVADAILSVANGDDTTAPIVGLAPGAGYGPSKCWPVDHFAAVGDALARDGAVVWLIGSPAERARCAAVADAMRAPVVDLSGRLDVGVLKAVVRRLAVLVGNDAGARHVATAFGVPCIVLFGPTSVARTPLNLERAHVLERDLPCRPCYLRHCPVDHACLVAIEPGEAIDVARDRMAGAGEAAR